MKTRRSAFTLIELLVVIGVIVVLIAILLPVFSQARMSAQSAVCQVQLRNLVIAWKSYCKDNDGTTLSYGNFIDGVYDIGWAEALAPYLQNESKLRLCPSTEEFRPRPGTDPGTNNLAYIADTPTHQFAGSYTFNVAFDSTAVVDWALPASSLFIHDAGYPQGGTTVPVFCDGTWRETNPSNDCTPPPDFDHGGWGAGFWGVRRVCIARHNNAINIGFADGHVSQTRLPTLWLLQWGKDTVPVDVRNEFPPAYQ